MLSLGNWTLKYESVWVIMFPHDIADDGSSLSEACSTPIIGAGSRAGSSHTVLDMDDIDPGHLATRSSLSSLGVSCDSLRIYLSFAYCAWRMNVKCSRVSLVPIALLIRNFHEKSYLLPQFNSKRIAALHFARINGMGEPARSRRRTTRILRCWERCFKVITIL